MSAAIPTSTGMLLAVAVACGLPIGTAAAAPHDQTLHAFVGDKDGATPYAGVVADAAGNLYGTTQFGGDVVGCPASGFAPQPGCGVIFKLAPPEPGKTAWTRTILHQFRNDPTGYNAVGGLVIDAAGRLYGTAELTSLGQYSGTVFSLTPPAGTKKAWIYRILHTFTGAPDGDSPVARLTRNPTTGVLYGSTYSGGAGAVMGGTVFMLTPPKAKQTAWTETVLHSFTGNPDGASPTGTLAVDSSGAVFGTTGAGGLTGYGTVYRLTPPPQGQTIWQEAVLHNFTGGKDGGTPTYDGIVLDQNGVLYGTAQSGGSHKLGVVYEVIPPIAPQIVWTQKVLHNFGATNDGATPSAGLTLDAAGALYGTTISGGVAGYGTVFKLTPPGTKPSWQEKVLLSFDYGPQGGSPELGSVTLDSAGRVYGTASQGGNLNVCSGGGCGTVFRITP